MAVPLARAISRARLLRTFIPAGVGVIIVVEGPSAAGKTTWIAAHCDPAMVIGEAEASPAPDRAIDPDGAAAHWAAISAARWRAARLAEDRIGTAVCDTDPLKLHYVWSLWQTGHASRHHWQAELTATRQLFARRDLGVADLMLVEVPDPVTLAARRQADSSRRRRNFDLHAQLAGPLRDWYHAVEQLDPARVRWKLPAAGLPDSHPGRRPERTGSDMFDALISQLPAR